MEIRLQSDSRRGLLGKKKNQNKQSQNTTPKKTCHQNLYKIKSTASQISIYKCCLKPRKLLHIKSTKETVFCSNIHAAKDNFT